MIDVASGWPALVGAGLFTGLMLGLTGAGGSVLTLPALVLLLDLGPHQAVAASLVSVGATALVGALRHAAEHNVRLGAAAIFAAAGGVAAAIGGRAGRLLDPSLVMVLFGGVMLIVAWRMAFSSEPSASEPRAGSRGALLALTGAGVGALSGFLGVGGGFLIVPVLRSVGRLPMKHAIGTGLAVIAINAFAGLAGALSGLDGVPWARVLPFVGASLVGGFLGARLVSRWSASRLARAFALLVAVTGVVMIARYVPTLMAG